MWKSPDLGFFSVNKDLKYLNKVDFACTNIVKQQPIKRPVVAIPVSHAHGRTWMKLTLEGPMLADTTKRAKLQWFNINLFPLSLKAFFSSLMASFCGEPRVYSRQKSGRWIVQGWISAHWAIRLSSTSSSLTMARRRNGRIGEWLRSPGESFLSADWSRGNQRVTQGTALFARPLSVLW